MGFSPAIPTVSDQQIIEVYQQLRSYAGIAKPNPTVPVVVNVPADGSIGAPYNIIHLNIATEGGVVRGNAFTTNTDGTITSNIDMFGATVGINAVGVFSGNDNVVIGIGIGNPAQIPTSPGAQVGNNYVSRFRCAREGADINDEVTWDLYVAPVGKSTTEIDVFGIKAGDKIFPVIWTQETDAASVSFREMIFTVEQISA